MVLQVRVPKTAPRFNDSPGGLPGLNIQRFSSHDLWQSEKGNDSWGEGLRKVGTSF